MELKLTFKMVFLAGLAWTLGVFLGSFIQYLVTTLAINPLLTKILG